MICKNCLHWSQPRSVVSLPDYPIGFCEIFQKDVAGELTGCAGKYFLTPNKDEWQGELHEKHFSADSPLELPEGVKIVSISRPKSKDQTVKVVYLVPSVD
jgi:hypothetical protein